MYPVNRPERIDDMLPDMFRRFFRPAPWLETADTNDLRLDVTENDKAYEVAAPVPGAKRDDIHVSVDGNLVSMTLAYVAATEAAKRRFWRHAHHAR